jgi:hypothetical protein
MLRALWWSDSVSVWRGLPRFSEALEASQLRKGTTMFLTITDDHSGAILQHRPLHDSDLLDVDLYAAEFADLEGLELGRDSGRVPLGCGDFTVELADNPGSGVCWVARSYFAEMGEF